MSAYKSLLRGHTKWQTRRYEAMRYKGFVCERCGEKRNLNIHHKFYDKNRMPWEYSDEELECLCEYCHEGVHQEIRISFYNHEAGKIGTELAETVSRIWLQGRPQHGAYQLVDIACHLLEKWPEFFNKDTTKAFEALCCANERLSKQIEIFKSQREIK